MAFRRGLFAAVLLLVSVAGPLFAAMPPAKEIAFRVLRGGEDIGEHRLTFRQEGDALHVLVEIELEVRLAFVTLFRYSHRNQEVWRAGRLVSLETWTNDDGTHYQVSGKATSKGFEVDGPKGRFIAPSDILPTSYWHPRTPQTKRMLDTQHGRLVEVKVRPLGEQTIDLAGRPVKADAYRLTGDLTLDLWYDSRGRWLKTAFAARGAEVEYAVSGGDLLEASASGGAQ